MEKQYHYTAYFQPLADGGFDVVFPAIPEICTFGETQEEARAMALDALRCYLESALKNGETLPDDVSAPPVAVELAVAVAV